MAGRKGLIQKRLKRIVSKCGSDVFRSYELNYDTISDGTGVKFSRLVSVTESNGNETLNPITLDWEYLPGFGWSHSNKYVPVSTESNPSNYDKTCFMSSDMNGDGVVSFRDAAIIAKYLANLKKHPELEEALKKGDFNGDGITNVRDYAAILEHLVENGVFGDRYKTWKDIVWREGDANLDDVFDLTDLVLTTKYALSPASFPLENEVAFVNADMNSDDKIDSVDINIMIEKQLGK